MLVNTNVIKYFGMQNRKLLTPIETVCKKVSQNELNLLFFVLLRAF